MNERITIDVDRDGWTKGLQLNIVKLGENDRGMGFRLAGPKYNGSSKNLLRAELDERDAAEIRAMLDAAFPLPPAPATVSRAEMLRQEAAEIVAYCPDHTGGEEAWLDCHCPVADEMRRRAKKVETDAATP